MKKFTIISDPGIDDIIALLLFQKLHPDSDSSLIATFGNAMEKITAVNAKEFIAFVAPHWTFIHGSTLPLSKKVEHPWPDYFHGPDCVWGIHPNVKTNSIKTQKKYPKNTDVISLAPMTDTLPLLSQDSSLRVTVMGGAFNVEGNETPYAETNIAFDPDAASEFFSTCRSASVSVIPLDVTRKVYWDIKTVQRIPESSGVNTWIKKMLLTWFEKYTHEREKSFNLHDPLAVYTLFHPSKIKWEDMGIEVVTKGEKRGMTIQSKSNPMCQVALDLVSGEAIASDIFTILFNS